MKTAISIPDALFQEAEKEARRLGLSRSELYARAVRAWLEARREAAITEALDAVYGDDVPGLEPDLARLQAASLARDSW